MNQNVSDEQTHNKNKAMPTHPETVKRILGFARCLPFQGMLQRRKGAIYYQKTSKISNEMVRTRIVHTSGIFFENVPKNVQKYI